MFLKLNSHRNESDPIYSEYLQNCVGILPLHTSIIRLIINNNYTFAACI